MLRHTDYHEQYLCLSKTTGLTIPGWIFLMVCCAVASASGAQPAVEFAPLPGALTITIGGQTLATYRFEDKEIPRPYFANVFIPGGPKLTRNHPPVPGQDDLDHGTGRDYFHPGIWLAFSDLNGNDYWRLKAQVRHEGFVEVPQGGPGQGSFVVRNSYREQANPDRVVCFQVCRYTISQRTAGPLLVCDSVFRSDDRSLVFGDQEEMGLGVRVAWPLAVKHGGQMVDSEGRVNEHEIWGHAAAWCDYSGTIADQHVGLMLIPDAANRVPCRFHARDYGLCAANPFGWQVFGEPAARQIVIERGEEFRLRFSVLLHAGPEGGQPDLPALFEDAAQTIGLLPRPKR